MTRHKITVEFAINDKNAQHNIKTKTEAWEEINKAIGELPPTVAITHVEEHDEVQNQ